MKVAANLMRRGFCTKAPEFPNYYILRIQYSRDGYYETYSHRKVFQAEVKKVEQQQQAKVFGGDHHPKNATSLIFNCHNADTVEKFVENCVYNKKKLITNWSVKEGKMLSNEKFEKLWQFYQPKLI